MTRVSTRCGLCAHVSTLDLAGLSASDRRVPLQQVEKRLRCGFRGYAGQKKSPCGARGSIDVVTKLKEQRPGEAVYWPVLDIGRLPASVPMAERRRMDAG